jgi:uncharacterized membrane protein
MTKKTFDEYTNREIRKLIIIYLIMGIVATIIGHIFAYSFPSNSFYNITLLGLDILGLGFLIYAISIIVKLIKRNRVK